jgi:hypothetical protein
MTGLPGASWDRLESSFLEPCLWDWARGDVREDVCTQCLAGIIQADAALPLFQPSRGALPAGTKDRGLAEEVLQRSLALAPSMSCIHGLRTRESVIDQDIPQVQHQDQSSG